MTNQFNEKEEFYCVYVSGQAEWNFTTDPEDVDETSWELVKFPTKGLTEAQIERMIETYLWEEATQVADSSADFDEEEEEWCDFVENNTTTGYVKYDPSLENHRGLSGFEDERPEHKEWQIKVAEERVRLCEAAAVRNSLTIESRIRDLQLYQESLEQEALQAVFALHALLESK